MTIDPRIGLWLSIVAAVVSALVAGGAEFTTIFGDQNGKMILAILGLVNTVINGINAVLHAIPAQTPGPAVSHKFPLGP
jgi:MFS superfamily sulfate permease-like transporter